MFMLDPVRGHRRRTLMRDKIFRAIHRMGHGLTGAAAGTAGHLRGLRAEFRAAISSDLADDWTIRERVRTAIGRALLSHPRALQVTVRGGHVVLSGAILADELDRLLATVRRTRGVKGIENLMDVYRSPSESPDLRQPGRQYDPSHRRIRKIRQGTSSE
jgi:hypothetical protein